MIRKPYIVQYLILLCISMLVLLSLTTCKQEAAGKSHSSRPLTPLDSINALILKDPEEAGNYAFRARLHRESANYGDAVVDMAEAMRRDSVNEDFHHLLADIYMESAKSQYAIGTMERAALLFPDSLATLRKLAEFNIIVRQYDRAAAALRQAMTIDPRDTKTLHLLGLMYREQENIERAVQTYQTIVEIDSDDAQAWVILGNLLDMQGSPMALQCFENAIDADPGYPQGWHSKAYYLQNHGRLAEAVQLYQRIHTLDSTYTDAWLNRGILYLELDSIEQARMCFNRLIELDTQSAIGHYYAGIAAQSMGDTVAARASLEHALQLAPNSQRVVDALNAMQ